MIELDDETLVAYVDGELEPEQRAAVEASLDDDPAAREKVRIFRESAAMLRDAYAGVLAEPVPERLGAALESAAPVVDLGARRAARRAAGSALRPALALAASLALVIGLGAGYLLSGFDRNGTPGAGPWPVWVAGTELGRALETVPSYGTASGARTDQQVAWELMPLSTFQGRDGRYCREFELSASWAGAAREARGVACRGADAAWRLELLVAGSAPAEGTAATGEGYAPAEAGAPDAYDALVESLMPAAPLSGAAEQALIDRGWR